MVRHVHACTHELIRKGFFAVAGHCHCTTAIRGQLPSPDSKKATGRSLAIEGYTELCSFAEQRLCPCIVRAMLSHIDIDLLQKGPLFRHVALPTRGQPLLEASGGMPCAGVST